MSIKWIIFMIWIANCIDHTIFAYQKARLDHFMVTNSFIFHRFFIFYRVCAFYFGRACAPRAAPNVISTPTIKVVKNQSFFLSFFFFIVFYFLSCSWFVVLLAFCHFRRARRSAGRRSKKGQKHIFLIKKNKNKFFLIKKSTSWTLIVFSSLNRIN